MRLDQYLVESGAFETRARARDAILRGTVLVNDMPASKPSQKVIGKPTIRVDDPAAGYVSRAALKLKSGLDYFGFSAEGKTCLDVGASTGGFTQVLLEAGASCVYAIDVGHDQLHPSIASNSKVVQRDGLNARSLTLDDLDRNAPEVIVSDVSFISLKLVLPNALAMAKPDAWGIFLVKPQFEAGKDRIGKGGLVAPDVAEQVAEDVRQWFVKSSQWTVIDMIPSPIKGGDGNIEFLLAARKP
ncbi:TlyA family RNA methyltransferase [Rhodobacteraceae bacterium RKSG542]|uniref:TlyA family RNA methyltransferase n=1 Tax=Pseudovibrio flavus TaxID=2529854 RepID=UPI0012BBF23C|nr:TlyA family RNA methyltransferase [Pseudovibrio flavus]MTI18734.1 TlyA family RNA methyltransferase [Pseudovibrio flavus]